MRYCDLSPEEPQLYNVVSVFLTRPFDPGGSERRFYTTSSCGICGKASLDQVEVHCAEHPAERAAAGFGGGLAARRPPQGPAHLRADRRAARRRAVRPGREGGAVREDVGRHNAVDKLVGRALLAGELPLSDGVLMVSGRVSFELVQKAAVAGVPVICAVSAPSSLAVEAADRLGLAVVGFVRGRGFNVYSHPERLDLDT